MNLITVAPESTATRIETSRRASTASSCYEADNPLMKLVDAAAMVGTKKSSLSSPSVSPSSELRADGEGSVSSSDSCDDSANRSNDCVNGNKSLSSKVTVGRKEDLFNAEKKSSFAEQLYDILDDESNSDVLSWMPDGQSFTITNHRKFTMDRMPKLFKIRNMSSFVRKLTRWGFSRVHEKETRNSDIFKHELFRRGERHLLKKIRCVTRFPPKPEGKPEAAAPGVSVRGGGGGGGGVPAPPSPMIVSPGASVMPQQAPLLAPSKSLLEEEQQQQQQQQQHQRRLSYQHPMETPFFPLKNNNNSSLASSRHAGLHSPPLGSSARVVSRGFDEEPPLLPRVPSSSSSSSSAAVTEEYLLRKQQELKLQHELVQKELEQHRLLLAAAAVTRGEGSLHHHHHPHPHSPQHSHHHHHHQNHHRPTADRYFNHMTSQVVSAALDTLHRDNESASFAAAASSNNGGSGFLRSMLASRAAGAAVEDSMYHGTSPLQRLGSGGGSANGNLWAARNAYNMGP